jgi:DNA (cytosine-5)-methyltransferase 1
MATLTVARPAATDMFCGAGGSATAARAAGVDIAIAMNHNPTAVDVHARHFPDAQHYTANISSADPRRFPHTDLLLASPSCVYHSQARGVSRRQAGHDSEPDLVAELSRATMWDVHRFTEQLHYPIVIVENVVEAVTKWNGFRGFSHAMADLGYHCQLVSSNAMHHGVAQSRDRVFMVFNRGDIAAPDVTHRPVAHCDTCGRRRRMEQRFKNGRIVGRYRTQWTWNCSTCGTVGEPDTVGAGTVLDWAVPITAIGDRSRPLAPGTRERVRAGLSRYGYLNDRHRIAGIYQRPPTTRGLLMRNNTGGAEMITPVTEPARTITTAAHQSVLLPGAGLDGRDPATLSDDELVDACGHRMLEPHEAEALMGLPAGYLPDGLTKRERFLLAGNAVCPPQLAHLVRRARAVLDPAQRCDPQAA